MQSREVIAMLSVVVVVAVACIGVGYGVQYVGSTINSDNTLKVTDMEFRLNEYSSYSFNFTDVAYFCDRDADGTLHYKEYSTESLPMKLEIVGKGSTEVSTMTSVKLGANQNAVNLKFQVYTTAECTPGSEYGSQVNLTSSYELIDEAIITDTQYWCKIYATFDTNYLKEHLSGAVKFDVVFYAEAIAPTI